MHIYSVALYHLLLCMFGRTSRKKTDLKKKKKAAACQKVRERGFSVSMLSITNQSSTTTANLHVLPLPLSPGFSASWTDHSRSSHQLWLSLYSAYVLSFHLIGTPSPRVLWIYQLSCVHALGPISMSWLMLGKLSHSLGQLIAIANSGNAVLHSQFKIPSPWIHL